MGQKYVVVKSLVETPVRFRDHTGTPKALDKKGTRDGFIKIIIDDDDWRFAANHYTAINKELREINITFSEDVSLLLAETRLTVTKPNTMSRSQIAVKARQIRDIVKAKRRGVVSTRLEKIRADIRANKGHAAIDEGALEEKRQEAREKDAKIVAAKAKKAAEEKALAIKKDLEAKKDKVEKQKLEDTKSALIEEKIKLTESKAAEEKAKENAREPEEEKKGTDTKPAVKKAVKKAVSTKPTMASLNKLEDMKILELAVEKGINTENRSVNDIKTEIIKKG